jgi:hypothetical protein
MRFIHFEFAGRIRQLDSVAQLIRGVHQNRRAAGSIPARGPIIVEFFADAPGLV